MGGTSSGAASAGLAYDCSHRFLMSVRNRYKNIIRTAGNRLTTIEQVKNSNESSFSSAPALFGIIKYVQTERQGISRSPKKTVTLIDPTDEEGLKVLITHKDGMFHPGDILHIRTLSHEQRARSVIFTAPIWDVSEVTSFTTDYEDEADQNSDLQNESQRTICKFLEEWFASQLLQSSSLEKLPQPDGTAFMDLVVQPIRKQLMFQSLVLRVWDGTVPNVPVADPFAPEHRAHHPTENWSEQIREDVSEISAGFTVDINVWSNEEKSRSACVHFETCLNQIDLQQDDYLLLLNVEVKSIVGNMVSLTMRSGHHKGKGARIVKSCSVMGRLFRQAMSQSLSRILERELSVMTSDIEYRESSPRTRKTTIEIVPDRVPFSIDRMKMLMQKLPPEIQLPVVFDNSITSLEQMRENLLQHAGDDSESNLTAFEYADLLKLVMEAKMTTE
jgi:hypothetical protein